MRIKNWETFQHFKDRRPPWVKLYHKLLDDLEWHKLDPIAAKTLVSLWLIASEDDGSLPAIEIIAFRLRTTEKSINTIVSQLTHWLIQDDIKTISSGLQTDTLETETETETETDRATRPKKITKAQSIPDGFTLNESSLLYAKQRKLADTEFEAFKNWHTAKGTTYRDWQAAWRTWCDKAVSYGRGKAPPKSQVETFDVNEWLKEK